jgi:hypothetical protein
MRDRQTGTLWSQLTGQALKGQLTGHTLSQIPTDVQPLAVWQKLHPDTELMSGDGGPPFVDSEYRLGMAAPEHGRFVLGTRVGPTGRGYPLTILDRTPILNDQIAGVPIVIAYDPQEGSGVVWDRRVGGRVLTFQSDGLAFSATDNAGGGWDLLRGVAVSGPLVGHYLTPVWSTLAYTPSWQEFFGPGSIYRSP